MKNLDRAFFSGSNSFTERSARFDAGYFLGTSHIEQRVEQLHQYSVFGGLGLFALLTVLTAGLLTCVSRELKTVKSDV